MAGAMFADVKEDSNKWGQTPKDVFSASDGAPMESLRSMPWFPGSSKDSTPPVQLSEAWWVPF